MCSLAENKDLLYGGRIKIFSRKSREAIPIIKEENIFIEIGGPKPKLMFLQAGALEGHWFRKNGQLVDVSEQNLIDCTKSYGNDGCMGGLVDPAFQYVRANGGVDAEEIYPYEGKDDQQCRFGPENVAVQCTGRIRLLIKISSRN